MTSCPASLCSSMTMSLRKSASEACAPSPPPRLNTLLAQCSNSMSWVTPRSMVIGAKRVAPGASRDADGSAYRDGSRRSSGSDAFADRVELFSAAWTIIDNLHGVRQLYRAMIAGHELGPLSQAFFTYSEDAHYLRNKMDHLSANIGNISKANGGGYPIFGVLSYLYSENVMAGGSIVTMLAGAMRGGESMPVANPLGLPTVRPVDHFQISAFGRTFRPATSIGLLCKLIERITIDTEQLLAKHADIEAGSDLEKRTQLLEHNGANLTMVLQFTCHSEI